MARVFDGLSGGEQGKQDHRQTFFADDQDRVEVPSSGFTADAHIARDGQDLLLTSPEGQTIEIKGYFSADAAPVVQAPDGSVLTPGLVSSFVQSAPEYAANDTASDASPIGAAQEVKGEAFVIHTDGSKEKIAIGTPIFEGDVIETSKEGAVNIGFIDDTSLAVSENARVALDHYTYDASTESGKQDISVLRGVFVFTSGLIGRDDPDDVHINTPVGSIGIRGTIIAGHINPGGESEISVLEGAIVVKNDANEVVLTQQYESVKVMGNNDAIENRGVLEASDISERFGAVSDVIPALFSAVNDSAKEQTDFTVKPAAEAPADAAQEAGEATAEEGAEDVAPTETMEPPAEPLPQDMMLDQPMMDNPLGDKPLFDIRPQGEFRPGGVPLPGTFEFKPDAPIGDRPPLLDPLRSFDPLQPPPQILSNNTGSTTTNTTVYGLVLNTATSAQDVSKIGDNAGNKIGYSISGVGDANNDGYDDLIFSNNTSAPGQNHTYVMYGSAAGISTGTVQGLEPGSTLDLATNIATANFNNSVVTGIGDFDGDGTEDFLVGQPDVNTSGRAYIMSGANPSNYIIVEGLTGNPDLGYSVTGIGDLNNDGRDDVVISAPGAGGYGAAYLFYGTTITGTKNVTIDSDLTFNGTAGSRFGEVVEGIGDIFGNGHMNFAIGAPLSNSGNGSVKIVYYGGGGTIVPAQYAGQNFGSGVKSVGDFNGDGRSDFISGGDVADANGDYYVNFTHSANGSSVSNFTILKTPYETSGGGGVGDWNGDGYDDFAVALQKDANTTEIYVLYGRAGAIPSYDFADLQNPANAFKMIYNGYAGDVEISAVGDVNGDGYDDMGIGLSDADSGNGQVLVVNGRNVAQTPNSHVGTDGADSSPAQFESYSGGAGDDIVIISNETFRNIDGGTGEDILRINGAVDLSLLNFEHVTQIEKLQVGPSGTLTLTAENIFNLIQTSDTGNLHIGGTSGSILKIVGSSNISAADASQVAGVLNQFSSGGAADNGSGMNLLRIDLDGVGLGNSSLYIDTSNLTVDIFIPTP